MAEGSQAGISPPTSVRIDAGLVGFVRKAVKRELGVSLELLAIEVETGPDPGAWRSALERFDAARTLFDVIGVGAEREPVALELDLDRWPGLGRLLESVYEAELHRLQNAAAEGYELPVGEIPALGRLVEDVREKTGAPPRKGHARKGRVQRFVQREREPRRSRNDG